ncbi:MAG: MFS transporter [Gordonia sp. (in: high G+C Gram-positive bacteria)]|uniref:MFS transporter n=1 Tax=Gordonia sp. (in: high G+C Gram-positive bacteria) TaxID=84139 RepID=UPI0039E5D574
MTRNEPAETLTETHFAALLVTVFFLQFLVALDMSLVNIALPEIQHALGFTASGLQWVVTSYLLTFAGFMLLGGRLGDLVGRRRVIITGLIVFAAASLVGGWATSAGMLIAARGLQGVAGALLAPAALALVTTVTDPVRHKKAMGMWGGAGAAGGAVGVVLSGLLTDWFSWRAVLFINVPIVLIALLGALRGVPRDRGEATGRLDVVGAILVTAGVGSLVYAVSSAGDHGWSSPRFLIGAVVAAVLLAGFAIVERSAPHPLMPPALMRRRSILGANTFGFMLAAGQLAAFYFASLYVQTVWHVDPGIAGTLFLPFSACVFVGIVVGNKLAAAIGARRTMVLMGAVTAVGLLLFSQIPAEFNFWLGILLPSAVTAIGLGAAMVQVGVVATRGVSSDEVGIASGVANSARQLGGTIGLAVLVTIASHFTVPREGFLTGFAVGALFLFVGSLLAWVILPRDDAATAEPT